MNAWVILVGGGYGAFLFNGTEEQVEEMRVHKARWERAIAKKRFATVDEVASGKPSHCWNHPGFHNKIVYSDCDCEDEDCVVDAFERQEPDAAALLRNGR